MQSNAKQFTMSKLDVVRLKWMPTLDVQVSSEVWRSLVGSATLDDAAEVANVAGA